MPFSEVSSGNERTLEETTAQDEKDIKDEWTTENQEEIRRFSPAMALANEAIKKQGTQTYTLPPQYQEYASVFSKQSFDKLPPKRDCDHAIRLIDGAKPYAATKNYPLTREEQKILDEWLEENLKTGRIRPSKSEWAAPTFFVKKKGPGLRPVQDYRELNKQTIRDRTPLPLIPELINNTEKSKFFTKLDIRWGYNNIRIKEEDCHKAAFKTTRGLFEPTVMLFGKMNAPMTFQAFMNSIFKKLIIQGVLEVYLDDILIHTENLDEHRTIVKEVLKILQENNLYLKLEKCEFEKEKVEYLGIIIGQGTVKMDDVKIQGIIHWPKPTKLKQVQSFLGFCNFYRRFIKDYSKITRPLHDLTKKEQSFEWKQDQQDAFDKLKKMITTAPVLTLPNADGTFLLEADSSEFATGAVLSQLQEDEWHPIAFYSKSLDETQRNYEIYDKEMMAIIRALEEWRHWLIGTTKPFEIWTDHRNLQYFLSARKLNRRQARWNLILSEYNFTLHHKPGNQMLKADALSRRPDHETDMTHDNEGITLLSPEKIRNIQTEQDVVLITTEGDEIVKKIKESKDEEYDDLIQGIKRKMGKNKEITDLGITWKHEDGIFTRNGNIVLPRDMKIRKEVLRQHHDNPVSGHPGRTRTTELITRNYWWPGMRHTINSYVDGCHKCQRNKTFPSKPLGTMEPLPTPTQPWEIISIDFITDLPESKGQNAIMMIADHFTKQLYAIPCTKEINSQGTARLFRDHVWMQEGFPKQVISDRGPQFVSEMITGLYGLLGIQATPSTARHPQTNGQVERLNQEIETYLRIFIDYYQNDWTDWLPIATFAYNTKGSTTTGHSPFYLGRGRHPNRGTEPTRQTENRDAQEFADHMHSVHQEAQSAINIAKRTMTEYYDKNRKEQTFEEGEEVFLNAEGLSSGRPKKKLDDKWLGPFTIKKKISDRAYELHLPRSFTIHPVIGISKLRKAPPDEFDRPRPRKVRLRIRGEDWIPERIKKSRDDKGNTEYLVKWKDHPATHDTWETRERLLSMSPDLLKNFEKEEEKGTDT
jgi:hypothetical protein